MGIDDSDIRRITESMSEMLPTVNSRILAMQDAIVTKEQAIGFLKKSTEFRWDSGKYDFNFDDFIEAERNEDKPMNAWTVFNIAQEKLINGKIELKSNGRARKARPVKDFIRENEINTKLWETAELMLV